MTPIVYSNATFKDQPPEPSKHSRTLEPILRQMQNVALLNVRSLFSVKTKLDDLAMHMTENNLQAFGIIEARTSPNSSATLTDIHHLGYGVYVPPQTHPHCGGLAVIYRLAWEINKDLTSYSKAADNNSECLILALNHSTKPDTTLTVVITYVPPSATTSQSKCFWNFTFSKIKILRDVHQLTPIILTDANAHCLTGQDKFTDIGIPDRSKPYAAKVANRNTRTNQTIRGTDLEILSAANDYCILNARAPGNNSGFTYRGPHSTVVDYILVPHSQYAMIQSFDVLEDSYQDFDTDHEILQLHAKSDADDEYDSPNGLDPDAILFPKFALADKDMQDKYILKQDDIFKPWVKSHFVPLVTSNTHMNISTQDTANQIHDCIRDMLRQAASQTFGSKYPKQPNSAPKPLWWSKRMSALSAQRRNLTTLMKTLTTSKRIPSDHPALSKTSRELIRTRTALRVEGRRAKHRHDTEYYHLIQSTIHKSLDNPHQSNALPWSITHKRRNTCRHRISFPPNMKPKRKPRATNPRQSALLFRDTWATISYLDDNDPIFDTAYAKSQRDNFDTWHAQLKKDPDIPRATPDAPFTISDTRQALNSLKSFRRYGSDGIPPELLRHAGYWLVKALTLAHNFYLRHSVHPQSWNTCPAMPLHKSGPRTDPTNYRLIAFMTATCKLYDSALTKRLVTWAESNHLISPNQYGYRKQTETTDLWYVYTKTITQRAAAGQTTYVASLDVKKAFPSVPRYHIWNTCHKAKMPSRLLLALINMSESARIWITIPHMSILDAYHLTQGVREGSVSSPVLYIIFVNDTLLLIEASHLGVHIRGIYSGASLFADDLSLLMPTPEALNKVLAILASRGFVTRTTYNAAKTDIIIFGETPQERLHRKLCEHLKPRFFMSGEPLTPVTELRLLGIHISDNCSFWPHLRHILSQAPLQENDLHRSGANFGGLDTRTTIFMWQMLYLPKFLASIHLWFNPDMQPELDQAITRPLTRALGHTNAALTQAQLAILSTELRILLSRQQHLKSLLQYTHRVPEKSPSNPARTLHEILMAENGDDLHTTQNALNELSLRWDHMLLPSWHDILQTQLLKGADYFLKSSSFHVTKKFQNSGINDQYQQRWSPAGMASVYVTEVILTDGCKVQCPCRYLFKKFEFFQIFFRPRLPCTPFFMKQH